MPDVKMSAQLWLEAENAVIGALLLDERLAPSILATVDVADIGDAANRRIYQAARALLLEDKPIDPVTLRNQLGAEYTDRLMKLMEVVPTTANWREYAAIMHEQAVLTRIRDMAHELMAEPTLEGCRGKIAALGEMLSAGRGIEAWTMADAYRYFMSTQDTDEKVEYVSYGIREVDESTFTELGDVIVVGGEPSSGKTLLALQMAYHMARRYKVGFFSLETKPKKLTVRLVSGAIDIDFTAIKRHQLRESDWQRVAEGGQDFTTRNLVLLRGGGMTASQIQAISRSYGFDVIFVDYVQMIVPETDPRLGQTQAMAAVSRSMHMFAQSSGTLVVELAQLSRPDKQSKWREPTMHDLKETGQLEQDADIILLLYKPKPGTEIDGVEVDPEESRILKLAKQKEGPLKSWLMHFDGAKQRMVIMAGPNGQAVMRHFAEKAKARKAKARKAKDAAKTARRGDPVPGQVKLEEVEDDGTMPF